jgi:hypothetical protein
MWLPSPWNGIIWAALAITLCTVCGLSYPVLPPAQTFWPPAGWNREPQNWGRGYERDQIQPPAGEFHRLQQPTWLNADVIAAVAYWPELPSEEKGSGGE